MTHPHHPAHPTVPTTGAPMGRREHLMLIGLVLVGGALGTSARFALEHALARPAGWPWVTFAINVVGSCALGLLLGGLAGRGADEGPRRAVRLGCGTGVLGGFTTYSTFVLEVQRLGDDGERLLAVAYPLASVVVGVLAAVLGLVLADRLHRRARARRAQGTVA
ncbi:FluC/FEX family fluoride channel [Cellulomonas palmilytica]|uniref:FluC/FEX family fluoride channel n=1 Tax=Cellulomonas palmilytica TaxID=2608402 RepID=UPI001F2FFCF1|nr:CrcB family protein [Cellulomonas palmilytica]